MKFLIIIFLSIWNFALPQNLYKPAVHGTPAYKPVGQGIPAYKPAGQGSPGTSTGKRLNLNPYMLQYLKQLLTRSNLNRAWQQKPTALNNVKLKAMSLNPRFQPKPMSPNPRLQPKPMSPNPRLQPSNLKMNPVHANPQLVSALYGSTFIQPSKGSPDAGKYTFAQVQPSAQPKSPTNRFQAPVSPNLGSMLYQYAKRQEVTQKQMPALNQNLYQMFGKMTYGPMPKPAGMSYRPPPSQGHQSGRQMTSQYQPAVQQTAYRNAQHQQQHQPQRHAPPPPPQQQQHQSYAPVSQSHAFTSQQKPTGFQSGYNQQQTMGFSNNMKHSYQPQQTHQTQRSGGDYSDGGGGGGHKAPSWVGSIHITGPADTFDGPSFTGYNSHAVSSNMNKQQNTGHAGYNGGSSANTGKIFGSVRVKPFIGAGTTCSNVPGNFCHGKKAGHYSHPNNRHCFMQCDAFGRGYDKECAPGTSWKRGGPEPAYYNMCS